MKLHELTIEEAHTLLKKKEISSEELTRAVFDRIDAVEGRVNAYIALSRDQAMEQAAEADRAIAGFTVNQDNINAALSRNPILVTALNTVIGYELGASIAKRAYAEGRAVIDVAEEMTGLSREELESLLDPKQLIG